LQFGHLFAQQKETANPAVSTRSREVAKPKPGSAFEFWHALKTLGVETQLVVYEQEGHMLVKPEHQRDRTRRTVAWFDAHLR
jgi:hypothetical protein